MMTGNAKRLARIFLNEWGREGWKILAESLPFQVEGEVFIGDPLENPGFDAYLIVNPLSRSKTAQEKLYSWLESNRDKLVLLYEGKYIGDSISRYRIRFFVDYLVAYRRETVDTEVVNLYKLENGEVVESSKLVRKGR
ncbi:hypothetical protein A3L09_05330 [Thermococcus profundus]|uniref:Uncharacterized protein n=2 Tax=Thermococcus profundus TaxID=49899 RepID=A0A2Z2MDT3_THEPR|nr:hypothetical protein A3L09_05330 [Thermococcus profundus]